MPNDLVKFNPETFLVLGPRAERAKASISMAFKGQITDKKLTRIRVPSGGGQSFALPSLEGTPINAPTFTGVIIYARGSRAWWQDSFEETGGGIRPDCYSSGDDPDTDMVKGRTYLDEEGNPRRPGPILLRCKKCPYNQWKSARKGGNGKDCGERNRLYVMRLDSALPDLFSVPTMSLESTDNYFLTLAGKALDYSSVVTRFGLQPAKGGPSGKIDYSQATYAVEAVLSEEHERVFQAIGASLKAKLLEAPADDDMYDEDDDEYEN